MSDLPELHEGHAPMPLHLLFGEAIDAYDDWVDGEPEPLVFYEGKALPIGQVFGHMRDCTDILPQNLLGAIKERVTRPLSSNDSLETITVSKAARVLCVLMRKRRIRPGGGDMVAFFARMQRVGQEGL